MLVKNDDAWLKWIRASALFFFEGLSLGMALWFLNHNHLMLLKPFILNNLIPSELRVQLIIYMLCAGVTWCLLNFTHSFFSNDNMTELYSKLSYRFSPLLISGGIPLLFFWRIWIEKEFIFLMFTAAMALSLPLLVRTSLNTFSNYSFFYFVSDFLKAHRWLKFWPLISVCIAVLGYTVFFSYVSITSHHNLRTSGFDMGIEDNFMWNLVFRWLAGDPNTRFFKTSPFSGPTGSVLGWHAPFISFLIAPFYYLYPHAETLLVAQALLVGLTALPIFLWGRLYVPEWIAAVFGVAYVFFSPVHGSNLYDFHWVNLGPFFAMMTLYLFDSKKDVWGFLFAALAMAVREDVVIGVCIIGCYLLLSGRRPRIGLALSFISLSYFIFIKLIIMPHEAGGSAFVDGYKGMLPPGEFAFTGVVKTVFSNPAYTLSQLLELQKIIYLLHFLVPLVFLPFYTYWSFLFIIPGFFVALLTTGVPAIIQPSFQYVSHFNCYMFALSLLGLSQLYRKPGGKIVSTSYVISMMICLLACSQMFGAFFQREHVRGGFVIYQFGTTPQDLIRRDQVKGLVSQIPPLDRVATTEALNPQVSNRPDAYTLKVSLFDADWMLVETPNVNWERPGFRDIFQKEDFGVVDIRGPFVLLKRHFDKTRNAELLQMIGG